MQCFLCSHRRRLVQSVALGGFKLKEEFHIYWQEVPIRLAQIWPSVFLLWVTLWVTNEGQIGLNSFLPLNMELFF